MNSLESKMILDHFDKPFLLEIASGDRPYDDGRVWLHTDIRPLPGVDLVCDATHELRDIVGEGSCAEIRAAHCLEHFPWPQIVNVLSCWRSMLAPNGHITIEVPNLAGQISALIGNTITEEEFVYFAYGEQDYPENTHKAAFTEGILRNSLEEAGFESIEIQDIGMVLIATAKQGSGV